jgi:Bax protein
MGSRQAWGWIGAALLLTGSTLADPAGPAYRTAPSQGRLWARQAVAAPRTVAYVPRPESVQGLMVRGSWGRRETRLPDFSTYRDVPTKKSEFFGYLLPLVEAENRRIAAIRQRLTYIYDHVRWHRDLLPEDRRWLERVGAEYGVVEFAPDQTDYWATIFERVDVLPVDLVLVQAANESAWGTSRFAREGNNLFGQWCFDKGCGMVPNERPDGATYEVARYESVNESIGSYMHNLNTGRSYQQLREIRARMRQEGRRPAATELAAGLVDYSERGLDYVRELRAMIRHNSDLIAELTQHGGDDRQG